MEKEKEKEKEKEEKEDSIQSTLEEASMDTIPSNGQTPANGDFDQTILQQNNTEQSDATTDHAKLNPDFPYSLQTYPYCLSTNV